MSAFSVTLQKADAKALDFFRDLSSVIRIEKHEENMPGSSSRSKKAKGRAKASSNGTGIMLVGGDESGSPIVARAQDVVDYSDASASGASTPAIGLPVILTGSHGTTSDGASTDTSRSSSPEQQRTRTTITTSTTSGTNDGSQRQMATTVQYTGAAAVSSDVGKDGTLHIHPIPSRKDRKVKVKKVISFIPRTSRFDRFHPSSQGDPFRGFYVLFWLMMGLTMSRVLYHGYLHSGEVVGMRFAKLISEDAIVLGISDGILVGTTILSVPFMKVSFQNRFAVLEWEKWQRAMLTALAFPSSRAAHPERMDTLPLHRSHHSTCLSMRLLVHCNSVDLPPSLVLGAKVCS